MPGHTPVLGFPYPLPADSLIDYPGLGQELATKLDPIVPWTPITVFGPNYGAYAPGDTTLAPQFMVGSDRRLRLRGLISKSLPPLTGDRICDLTPPAHAIAEQYEFWPALMTNGAVGGAQAFVAGLSSVIGAASIQIATAFPPGFAWQVSSSWISLSGGGWACAP